MSVCRFVASDQPRVLRTHIRDCNASGCEGCAPCPEDHCGMCGHRHVDQLTCASCIGTVREDIGIIVALAERMLPEAMHRGVNSEAAMLAGPAASAETFSNRNISARAGRIPATILIDNLDEMHPLWVLGTWDMLVSEHLGRVTRIRVTIQRAADYLRGQLTTLAQDEDFAFEELAREIRQCRGHLEDVLRDGERDEKGAPCPMCGNAALVKQYGTQDADDRWCCPKRDCSASYTEDAYRNKVEGTYVHVADRLTASQIHQAYRVPPGTVMKWAQRDQVRRRGKDESGRQLYDVSDVKAMRDRDMHQDTA